MESVLIHGSGKYSMLHDQESIERVVSSQNRLIHVTKQSENQSKGFVPSPLKHKKTIARAGWQPVLEADQKSISISSHIFFSPP
jgi:hypothetical protein